MSDFLGKIAARAVGEAPVLRPRPLSTFEPEPHLAMPTPFLAVERETDQGEPSATRRTPDAVPPAEPPRPANTTMRDASLPDTPRERPAAPDSTTPGSGHEAPRRPEPLAQQPPPDHGAAPIQQAPPAQPAPARPRARAAAASPQSTASPPVRAPAPVASQPTVTHRLDLPPPPAGPPPRLSAQSDQAGREVAAEAASSSAPPVGPSQSQPRPPPQTPGLMPAAIAAPTPGTAAPVDRPPASAIGAPLHEPRPVARPPQPADVFGGLRQRPMRPAAEPVADSPAIELHIGRLELHAAPAPPAPQPRPGPSLDAFLNGRRR